MTCEQDCKCTYESLGEFDLNYADGVDNPVNIQLKYHDGYWHLLADNYSVDSQHITDVDDGDAEAAYHFRADTREALEHILMAHWIPLYRSAVTILEDLALGSGDGRLEDWRP